MTIFIVVRLWGSAQGFEIRVLEHELATSHLLEIHFDPRMGAAPFDVQDDALAEFAVTDTRAEPYAGREHFLRRTETADGHRARDLHTRPHFLDQLRRNFLDESR